MTTTASSASIDPPVFVIGVARSGTTVTYSMLLASGAFPVYETEGRLMECSRHYGSLASRSSRRRFLRDFLRSRQFRRSGLQEADVVALVEETASFLEFLDLFMASLCRAQGKSRWAEKSPNNTFFVDELARFYPRSKFVHVIRDGRAVVASQRKLGWSEKYTRDRRRQLLWIGSHWSMMVAAGRKAARLGPERYLEVRYEDLVRDPEGTLDRLGRFVGVRLEPEQMERSDVGTLGKANTAFGETGRGISEASLLRWRAELEPGEVDLLNWQLADRLQELGYPLDGNVVPDSPDITLRDRATSAVSRLALVGQQVLKHHTLVGRLGRPPLEIGLS